MEMLEKIEVDPNADRKLPGLRIALDNAAVRDTLAATCFTNGVRLEKVQSRVLKYKPGKTCVIAYSCSPDAPEASPIEIIGKMYRKSRGEDIARRVERLWRSTLNVNGGPSLQIPEPLGYAAKTGLVFQRRASGRVLTEFGPEEDVEKAILWSARNLAALHLTNVIGLPPKTMRDHIDKLCHPGPQKLCKAAPETSPLVRAILTALEDERRLANLWLCPVHGDMNLSQIIVQERNVCFIDFDGLCLSHPALDVGNFIVTIKVKFPEVGEKLAETFLSAYLEQRNIERVAGLHLYMALAYLRRAMIQFRSRKSTWLKDAVKLLQSGKSCLESV